MTSPSDLYRKLCRLWAKRKRLDRRIANLERRLVGKRGKWGNCSYRRNRRTG
jgi:hypothetical protein